MRHGGRVRLALATALAVAGLAAPAQAATITVSAMNDELTTDGDCSLREAVRAANLNAAIDACVAGDGADTIQIPAGTVAFALAGANEDTALTGDLDLTQAVTIAGAGEATTTIDANALDRIFELRASVDFEVRDLTLTDGDAATGDGGAVSAFTNGSTLRLTRVTATANESDTGDGGAIEADELTITDSTFTDNVAGDNGGAIDANDLEAHDTTVSENRGDSGGGMFVNGPLVGTGLTVTDNGWDAAGTTIVTGQAGGIRSNGALDLTDSTISGNAADNVHGGIEIRPGDDPARLLRVTVTDNVAQGTSTNSAGGIGFLADDPDPGDPPSSLVIEQSLIEGNTADEAGGIELDTFSGPTTPASVTIRDTRITGNVATVNGGGIEVGSGGPNEVTIERSTIDDNRAATFGAGIYNHGALTVRDSTISENGIPVGGADEGGGIWNGSSATTVLESVTFAYNAAGDGAHLFDAAVASAVTTRNSLFADPFNGDACGGTLPTSLGGNGEYSSNPNHCGFADGNGDTTGPALDTDLAALADNGGMTPTHALAPDALPVDAGAGCGETDQRGVSRPEGAGCDQGAYEFDDIPPETTILSGPEGTTTDHAPEFGFAADEAATFECSFDGGAFAPCTSPFAPGALGDGPHALEVLATDVVGNVEPEAARREFTVVPAPPPPDDAAPPPGGPLAGGVPPSVVAPPVLGAIDPRIESLSLRPRRFRAARRGRSVARVAAVVGTTVNVQATGAATVRFTVERRTTGRRRGGRCVKPTRKLRRARRCVRHVRMRGSFSRAADAGAFRFTGRLRGRALRPRRYRLVATPLDGAGRAGKRVRAAFRIVRR